MQIISNKKWGALQTQIKALQQSNLSNIFSNLVTQIFPHWQVFKEVAAYQTIDDIYSVVSRLATEAAMIPLCGYNEKGEELQPGDPLNKFIQTLTFQQREIMYTFLWGLAECFMYKEKLELGPNAGLSRLHFLHPGRMVIVLSESFPTKIVGYTYFDSVRGIRFNIEKEDMAYISLFNPSLDSLEEWRGLSPVKVLSQRLTRVQSNISLSTAQMQNGGIKKIVYSKLPGIEIGSWDKLKEQYGRFSNNPANSGGPFFGGADLGVLDIGSSVKDMDLLGIGNVDFKKICNAFSVSDVLFNSDTTAKYDNANSFEKSMYTAAVLPMVKRVEDCLNKDVVPDIKTKGHIMAVTKNIAVLQENQKEKAEAWAAQPAIVINEMRVAMGQDESTEPMADRLLVKTGYILADDLLIEVEPIDNDAGDYVKP